MTVFGVATAIAASGPIALGAAIAGLVAAGAALAGLFFTKDVGASTMLEGLGKISHGFGDIGTQAKLSSKSLKTLGTEFDKDAPTAAAARRMGANTGGGGGATQTVRQPIRMEIGGKVMKDYVIEVVGKEIININLAG